MYIHRRTINAICVVTIDCNTKANPKQTALRVELAQIEAEIEKLLDQLTGAKSVLMSYANDNIEALDAERQMLLKAIADLSVDSIAPAQILRLSSYLDDWDNVDLDDKRQALDFDIIFLDIQMERLTGLETAFELRKRQAEQSALRIGYNRIDTWTAIIRAV